MSRSDPFRNDSWRKPAACRHFGGAIRLGLAVDDAYEFSKIGAGPLTRSAKQATTRPEVKIAAGVLLAVGSVLMLFGFTGCIAHVLLVDPSGLTVELPVVMLIAFAGVVCWVTAFGITKAASIVETRSAIDWRKMNACPMCGGRLSGPECTDCGEKLDQAGID